MNPQNKPTLNKYDRRILAITAVSIGFIVVISNLFATRHTSKISQQISELSGQVASLKTAQEIQTSDSDAQAANLDQDTLDQLIAIIEQEIQDNQTTTEPVEADSTVSTINQQLLKILSDQSTPPSTTSQTTTEAFEVQIKDSVSGTVDVFEEPLFSSRIITQLTPDTTYTYTKQQGDWYQIATDPGQNGWVHSKYVQTQ